MKFVLPIVVLTSLFITACGQKGPLYLPETPQVVEETKPEDEPASQASVETDEQQPVAEKQGEKHND